MPCLSILLREAFVSIVAVAVPFNLFKFPLRLYVQEFVSQFFQGLVCPPEIPGLEEEPVGQGAKRSRFST